MQTEASAKSQLEEKNKSDLWSLRQDMTSFMDTVQSWKFMQYSCTLVMNFCLCITVSVGVLKNNVQFMLQGSALMNITILFLFRTVLLDNDVNPSDFLILVCNE